MTEKSFMLENLMNENAGYLTTAEAMENGVSRTTLADFVKKKGLQKIARGIYISSETWEDDLYCLYLKNREIIFSMETALSIHGLMEREPDQITVTVKQGYNATHLRKKDIQVRQLKKENYLLGKTEARTYWGNVVSVYDKERCICDIIKNKQKMDIQVFTYALKEYMRSKDKDLIKLQAYAKKLGIEEKVHLYTEVML